MRTVKFSLNISIDGYCDHTIFNPDEELMDYFTELMDDVDLLFFGRVMYQLMFPYWAEVAKNQSGTPAENNFARKLTAIDKVVVSRSLKNDEQKARIVNGNPAEELLELQQLPGKKISVDSVSMLPELMKANLVDEFHLVVHPVIVGKGRCWIDADSLGGKIDLMLVGTRVFQSGCVALHYVKQR